MAKAPLFGHGKQRLARSLGKAQALRINRRLHAISLRAALSGRWRVVLAVSPRSALRLALPGVWPAPGKVPRRLQGRGDLGQRIAAQLRGVTGPVCVVGTDAPEVSAALLRAAFRALQRAPAVLGPAVDGGFWLVGVRRAPDLIAALPGVRWSTPEAGADMAARLPQPLRLLPTLRDIDEAADWYASQRRGSSIGT
jgi:glycosyltransferase A (GT-A) superfamily protein (DUF2064 family)